MDVFVDPDRLPAQPRFAEHGGAGPISFRRLMEASQFASALDFVDFTIIPAGSSIGVHFHQGSEELYFVAEGTPLINVNGTERRVGPGSLAVVRSGEWHSLTNDTAGPVTLLVVQAHVGDSHER
jgi:mannose-6-phosphate isomerase-like protein (cupin superfamily)